VDQPDVKYFFCIKTHQSKNKKKRERNDIACALAFTLNGLSMYLYVFGTYYKFTGLFYFVR